MSVRILMIFFLLSSCSITRNNIFAPNKRLFKKVDKTNMDFYQGYQDGCETGLATGFANDYYKLFYGFKKDSKKSSEGNKYYLRAWSMAMTYCRHYALGTLKDAGMTPRLPGAIDSVGAGGLTSRSRSHPVYLEEHNILTGPFGMEMGATRGAQGLSKW